jgi:hypothetical protein
MIACSDGGKPIKSSNARGLVHFCT